MNYGRIVGYYFIILGVIKIAFGAHGIFLHHAFDGIKSVFWAGLLFILAYGLLKNRNGYRIASIILCSLNIILYSLIFLPSFIIGTEGMRIRLFGVQENPPIQLVVLEYIVYLLLFGPALIGLILPQTKKHYIKRNS